VLKQTKYTQQRTISLANKRILRIVIIEKGHDLFPNNGLNPCLNTPFTKKYTKSFPIHFTMCSRPPSAKIVWLKSPNNELHVKWPQQGCLTGTPTRVIWIKWGRCNLSPCFGAHRLCKQSNIRLQRRETKTPKSQLFLLRDSLSLTV
jgi:hypothetical protein